MSDLRVSELIDLLSAYDDDCLVYDEGGKPIDETEIEDDRVYLIAGVDG